jgi:hypothetical protein
MTTTIKQHATREIPFTEWIPFLAAFTREYRGAHARLEVVGPDTDVGYQVETEDRPLDGISADTKDGERIVWISFATSPEGELTHGVQPARALRLLPPDESNLTVVEVEASDGTKTILELTRPEEYALPPANS